VKIIKKNRNKKGGRPVKELGLRIGIPWWFGGFVGRGVWFSLPILFGKAFFLQM